MSRIPKKDRSVSRAYGGNRCHKCVRNKFATYGFASLVRNYYVSYAWFFFHKLSLIKYRILRAFLTEEQKIVKKLKKARAPEARRKARLAEKKRAKEEEKAKKEKEERAQKRREKRENEKEAKRPRRGDKKPMKPRTAPKH